MNAVQWESRPHVSGWAVALGLAGLGAIAWAIAAGEPSYSALAVPCAAAATMLQALAWGRGAGSFDAEGLKNHHGDVLIAGDDLLAVRPRGMPVDPEAPTRRPGSLAVAGGNVEWHSPCVSPPPQELYGALLARLEALPNPQLDGEFGDEQRKLAAQFGDERLLAARFLAMAPGASPLRAARCGWFTFGAGCVAGFAVAMLCFDHRNGDMGLTAGLLIAGAFMSLVVWLSLLGMGRGPRRRRRPPQLLVSPLGVLLDQEPLKGKLRWGEIRSVKLNDNARFGRTHLPAAIVVQVDGAAFEIEDVYDRPLWAILRMIRAYAD